MVIDAAYRTSHGLTDEMRSALASQGNAILGTINADDGSPHLTEILFMLDEDDRVLLPTPRNTKKVRNVLKNPVATVFFYDQPGWSSCTGRAEIIEGTEAAEMNQRNRDRLLTEAGHDTIGRLLAAHEDVTIVVSPQRWLSWSSSPLIPAIEALGGDVDSNPPDTWWKELP